MENELKTVSLNAPPVPAAPITAEIKSLAHRYLTALGVGAEKAEKEAERLGHDFIVAHYHAGTDPFEEERALAAKESATGSADVSTGAASEGTSTPAAPAAAPETAETFVDIGLKNLDGRIDRLVDHVNREIGVAGDTSLHERLTQLEDAFKAHVETNFLAAHPLPPAPETPQTETVPVEGAAADNAAAAPSEPTPNLNEQ